MATRRATPAARARARRDPAIFKPPPRVRGDRTTAIRNLAMKVGGRTYPIGANIEGDTPWSMGMDQTGTVTLPLRDPSDSIVRILDDENLIQLAGVRITIDRIVYVVTATDHDGDGLYALTLEDEVSWRLRGFSKYRAASRARTTRFGFIYGFIREASRKPFPRMRAFIPEVDDKQPIRRPKRTDD